MKRPCHEKPAALRIVAPGMVAVRLSAAAARVVDAFAAPGWYAWKVGRAAFVAKHCRSFSVPKARGVADPMGYTRADKAAMRALARQIETALEGKQ